MEKRRTWIGLVVSGAVLLVGLWVFLYKDALFPAPSVFERGVSKKVPDVLLDSKKGAAVKFDEFLQKKFSENPNAKFVLLSFWATWCGPCTEEIPLLDKKASGYRSRGLEIVLVNFDNAHASADRQKVLEWLSNRTKNLETIFDPRDALTQGLELSALPFNAVVARDLTWAWGDYGAVDFDKLEKKFISPPQN